MITPPSMIQCVDCGGESYLLDRLEEGEKVQAGTILAYRCNQCMDRWDIEIGE